MYNHRCNHPSPSRDALTDTAMDMSSEADTSIKLDVLKLDRLSDPQPSPHSHRILSTAFKVLSRGCRGFANLLHREKDVSFFIHLQLVIVLTVSGF